MGDDVTLNHGGHAGVDELAHEERVGFAQTLQMLGHHFKLIGPRKISVVVSVYY